MKPSISDVICLHGDEQLYAITALTGSQLGYMKMYDHYDGVHGEDQTIELPSGGFEILGNVSVRADSFPEHLEVCRICHWRVEEMSGEECFDARMEYTGERTRIAKSKSKMFIRDDPVLWFKFPDTVELHAELVAALEADGWQRIIEKRPTWFGWRFQRPKAR